MPVIWPPLQPSAWNMTGPQPEEIPQPAPSVDSGSLTRESCLKSSPYPGPVEGLPGPGIRHGHLPISSGPEQEEMWSSVCPFSGLSQPSEARTFPALTHLFPEGVLGSRESSLIAAFSSAEPELGPTTDLLSTSPKASLGQYLTEQRRECCRGYLKGHFIFVLVSSGRLRPQEPE